MKQVTQFVKLTPEPGYVLMDQEKHNSYKEVMCPADQVSSFVEVLELEAERLIKEYEKQLEAEQTN